MLFNGLFVRLEMFTNGLFVLLEILASSSFVRLEMLANGSFASICLFICLEVISLRLSRVSADVSSTSAFALVNQVTHYECG